MPETLGRQLEALGPPGCWLEASGALGCYKGDLGPRCCQLGAHSCQLVVAGCWFGALWLLVRGPGGPWLSVRNPEAPWLSVRGPGAPSLLSILLLITVVCIITRGGVEDTRLEAKAKDTKKIRGQGEGQPFRG